MGHDRKALLIDFDGTLADSLGVMRRAYAAFMARFDAKATEQEFQRLNGPPLAEIVATLRQTHALPISQKEALQLYQREIDSVSADLRPSYGAQLLLESARGTGWRVGVVTSNERSRVEAWLEHHGLARWVETVIGGDTKPGKPDPAPYRAALERLCCTAASSVAIEDSPQGYAAAVGAGLRTLYYCPLDRVPGPASAEHVASLPATLSFLCDQQADLTLRLAAEADMPFLYGLRNDPSVARVSRTPRNLSRIELEERFRLDESLRDKITMIAEESPQGVAMVRFDREEGGYSVSIAVESDFRGQGRGSVILQSAIDAFQAMRGPARLLAEVAEDNASSIALFTRCGFAQGAQDGRFLRFAREPS